MKGFNLATVGGSAATGTQSALTSSTPSLAGSSVVPVLNNACSRASMQTLNETTNTSATTTVVNSKGNPMLRSPITKLAQLARLAGAKKADSKKKWGNLIEAAKSAKGVGRMWARSRSRSEDSVSSDGSAGTVAQAPDDPTNCSRRDKYTGSRSGYPVVHVTENELPEVLEESGIDYELSGRMAMDSTTSCSHSPIASLRRFRRACSEPVDQVTLILEEESLPTLTEKKIDDLPCSPCSVSNVTVTRPIESASGLASGAVGAAASHLRFRRSGEISSSIGNVIAPARSRDWMAGQNFPDNIILPFVDESADTMMSTMMSSSPTETVLKYYNGGRRSCLTIFSRDAIFMLCSL